MTKRLVSGFSVADEELDEAASVERPIPAAGESMSVREREDDMKEMRRRLIEKSKHSHERISFLVWKCLFDEGENQGVFLLDDVRQDRETREQFVSWVLTNCTCSRSVIFSTRR